MSAENEQSSPTPSEDERVTAEAIVEAAEQLSADEANASSDSQDLQAEVAELKDRLLRSQAELENFRRRVQKEAQESARYASLPLIRDLLPGVDNLQRAVDAAEQSGDTENLIQGVKMVASQFTDALKNHNVSTLKPEGEAFDPNLHEALTQVPSADHEPMTVLQVIETGYQLFDRVIRPAKVMVSCSPPEDSDGSTPD